jgi:hypothetical protein
MLLDEKHRRHGGSHRIDLRRVDGTASPPRLLDRAPDTNAGQRLRARFFQALPIESQL